MLRGARQRLPLRKAGIDRMPGDYCGFAKLPAKKNHLALLHLAREINEALVDVLEQASVGLDLFRRLSHLISWFPQLRVTFDHFR